MIRPATVRLAVVAATALALMAAASVATPAGATAAAPAAATRTPVTRSAATRSAATADTPPALDGLYWVADAPGYDAVNYDWTVEIRAGEVRLPRGCNAGGTLAVRAADDGTWDDLWEGTRFYTLKACADPLMAVDAVYQALAGDGTWQWAEGVLTVTRDGLTTVLKEASRHAPPWVGRRAAALDSWSDTASATTAQTNLFAAAVTVAIAQPKVAVGVGRTVRVPAHAVAAFEPAQDVPVRWASANPKVAKVNARGVIRGLRAGRTVVTASAGGASASLTVLVGKAKAAVRAVTLKAPRALTIGTVGYARAAFTPGAFRGLVAYASSNPLVATVDRAGVIRAHSPGRATITAAAGGETARQAVSVARA
jgi:hypothetical protein